MTLCDLENLPPKKFSRKLDIQIFSRIIGRPFLRPHHVVSSYYKVISFKFQLLTQYKYYFSHIAQRFWMLYITSCIIVYDAIRQFDIMKFEKTLTPSSSRE